MSMNIPQRQPWRHFLPALSLFRHYSSRRCQHLHSVRRDVQLHRGPIEIEPIVKDARQAYLECETAGVFNSKTLSLLAVHPLLARI
jgi:hypothetical protein